ncbi:MAG: hypothetical protein HYS13_07035 [Planctomycetia bacterium]|nr:hypothetical protein [Planctomycetia bacterium]
MMIGYKAVPETCAQCQVSDDVEARTGFGLGPHGDCCAEALPPGAVLERGDIGELETTTGRLDATSATTEAQAAAQDVLMAQTQLKALIGLAAAGEPTLTVADPPPETLPPSPDGLVAQAMALRLDLGPGEMAVESAAQRAGLARTEAVAFTAVLDENDPEGPIEFGPGLEFRLPILNGNRGAIVLADTGAAQPEPAKSTQSGPGKSEPRPGQEDQPTTEFEAGYDGGFYIKDKDVKLTIEGLLQVNALFFEDGGPHESEFVLRRFRPEFSGEFYDIWRFHFEPKFSANGVELEEAWLGLQVEEHRFIFGRMKEPFSLEEMTSQRHMDMLNFSILNQFVPAEDHGITVFGLFDWLEYGVGFYNGTGGDDTTSDKDGAIRLVIHPWRGLQFGGSATFGRQDTDISGGELNTEARVPWAEFEPGTTIDGERVRWGAEAAFLEGPFALTTEIMGVRQELNGTAVHLTGGYLQGSYVLTGEDKTWKGIQPLRPFLREPDWGAWQLVARWSRLSLGDEFSPFLTNFPKTIDSITFGVNWYVNDHVKVKLNYLRTIYDRSITVDGVRHDDEDVVMVQLQVHF